jgi:hypothetical protein
VVDKVQDSQMLLSRRVQPEKVSAVQDKSCAIFFR